MISSSNYKKIQQSKLLPKSTQDSISKLQSWDEDLKEKNKLKNQYQQNGGGSQLLSNINSKRPNFSSSSNTNTDQMNSTEIRALQQKRKLQEIARSEDQKLKTQRQQQQYQKDSLESQDASDEYEVEKIVDKKIEKGQVLYRVKWKGV